MKDVVTKFPWPWLPTTALIIFFTLFILLLFRLSQKHRQPILNATAHLPLEEGELYVEQREEVQA